MCRRFFKVVEAKHNTILTYSWPDSESTRVVLNWSKVRHHLAFKRVRVNMRAKVTIFSGWKNGVNSSVSPREFDRAANEGLNYTERVGVSGSRSQEFFIVSERVRSPSSATAVVLTPLVPSRSLGCPFFVARRVNPRIGNVSLDARRCSFPKLVQTDLQVLCGQQLALHQIAVLLEERDVPGGKLWSWVTIELAWMHARPCNIIIVVARSRRW